MPKTIAHKIVQIQRRFFWGGANEASGEKMGCTTIKWANIELPKELGGSRGWKHDAQKSHIIIQMVVVFLRV